MAVVPDEHELAADAHVDTAEEHDRPRHHAPQHQEEESPFRLIVDDHAGVVVLIVVAVKYGSAGVVRSIPPISAVSESYVIRIETFIV